MLEHREFCRTYRGFRINIGTPDRRGLVSWALGNECFPSFVSLVNRGDLAVAVEAGYQTHPSMLPFILALLRLRTCKAARALKKYY